MSCYCNGHSYHNFNNVMTTISGRELCILLKINRNKFIQINKKISQTCWLNSWMVRDLTPWRSCNVALMCLCVSLHKSHSLCLSRINDQENNVWTWQNTLQNVYNFVCNISYNKEKHKPRTICLKTFSLALSLVNIQLFAQCVIGKTDCFIDSWKLYPITLTVGHRSNITQYWVKQAGDYRGI